MHTDFTFALKIAVVFLILAVGLLKYSESDDVSERHALAVFGDYFFLLPGRNWTFFREPPWL